MKSILPINELYPYNPLPIISAYTDQNSVSKMNLQIEVSSGFLR